ncbi:MAG: 23S rRNA (pseudouridine(1915)-N(3))-methyltransferase RlmH, partial [Gammaproteobacteria bacterium]
MRLRLLCVSRRPAAWVADAGQEYLRRLKGQLDVEVREIAPAQAANAARQKAREGEMILKAAAGATLVALDERGTQWSTREFADTLARWRDSGTDVVLAIGGAEGHSDAVRAHAAATWSLSR